jgi:hypothetical protein
MKTAIKLMALLMMVFSIAMTMVIQAASPDDNQLTFKEAIWVKTNDEGRLVAVPNAAFRRGEVVNLVLRNVEKFQKGNDGKHRFDIDMTVKDPTGSVVLDKKGLLGEEGHRLLENDTASSPYGIFESHVGLEPGTYEMTLTVHDKISGTNVSVTKSFSLSAGLSYQKAVFARKGNDGTLEQVPKPMFSRGEVVNLIFLNVGKFEKGTDGKHLFDIDMTVKNSEGETVFQKENMLGENGHTLLPDDIAKSPYGMFYSSIEMEAGVYRMTLTIYDKIGNERVSVTKPFTLK